jgi:hypothetical protein
MMLRFFRKAHMNWFLNSQIQVGIRADVHLDEACKGCRESYFCKGCNKGKGVFFRPIPDYQTVERVLEKEFNDLEWVWDRLGWLTDNEKKLFNSKYKMLSLSKESILDGIQIQKQIRRETMVVRVQRAIALVQSREQLTWTYPRQAWFDIATLIFRDLKNF